MNKNFMPRASLAALMAAVPVGVLCSPRMDAGFDPSKLESLLSDVKSELKRVGDDVKQTAEQALKQAKESGSVSAEVKAAADKLLTDQAKLNDAQQRIEGKLEQLETRQTDIEQSAGSRRGGGSAPCQTLGQMVGEHDKIKAFAAGGAKGTVTITLQNAITSIGTSGGALITPQRDNEIVAIPRRQLTIRNLLDAVRITAANSVEYARMVERDNKAAVVAEGNMKPESNYRWELKDALVRTVAHWVPVSRQAMDDIPQLQGEIDGELRYGLDLNEEAEILKGDGTGQHLHGMVPQATGFAVPSGITVANATRIDVLRIALLQASLAEYVADGMVLNPIDWAGIELQKDGEQRYIFANVIQLAGPQLWGRPVLSTQAMDQDEFLVGAFRAAAKIYDRMDTEVLISSEDRDNFVKNMLTVRAEKRLALAVKRPPALVTGDFTTALAGIPAPAVGGAG